MGVNSAFLKVSGMSKEKLSDPGSSDPSLDLQDMLVKLTSRVATLECFYGCDFLTNNPIDSNPFVFCFVCCHAFELPK